LNSCTGGILSDIPDTPAQYLWICLGQRGGSNASCSLLRPTNQTNDLDAKGYHDSSSCNYITGWACDPDSYVAQLQILFYADGPRHVSSGWSSSSNRQGIFIGSTIANTSREVAVGSQCGGYTAHGFRFVTPQIVKDSLTHPIYAYAVGIRSNGSTGFYRLLTGSPKSLTNCTINNNTLTVR
jgi:hypothetical protein